MTVNELREKVEAYRKDLKENKKGKTCVMGEAGPVGMVLIDAVVTVLADLEKSVKELEGFCQAMTPARPLNQ